MGWVKDKGNKPLFKEGGKVKKVAKTVSKNPLKRWKD